MNVASPNQKVQKGWLSRWTRKQWSRHWFVLKNGSLTYYRGPAAELCSFLDGVLDLSLIKHIEVQQVDGQHVGESKSSSSNNNNTNSSSNQYQQLHYTGAPTNQSSQSNLNSRYNFSLKMWNGECHTLGASTLAERSQWLDAINACTNGELADDETSTDSASSASSDSSPTSNLSAKSTDVGTGVRYHLRGSYASTRSTNNQNSNGQDAAATQLSLDKLAIKLKSAIRRRSDEQQQDVVLLQQMRGQQQQVVALRESDTPKATVTSTPTTIATTKIGEQAKRNSEQIQREATSQVESQKFAIRHSSGASIDKVNVHDNNNSNETANANQLNASSQHKIQSQSPPAATAAAAAASITTSEPTKEQQQPSQLEKLNASSNQKPAQVQDIEIDDNDEDEDEEGASQSFKRRLMCFKARDSLDLDSLKREPKLIAHKSALELATQLQSGSAVDTNRVEDNGDHRMEQDDCSSSASENDDDDDVDDETSSSTSLSDHQAKQMASNASASANAKPQVRLPAPPLAKILRTSDKVNMATSQKPEVASKQKKRVTFDLSVAKLGGETSSSSEDEERDEERSESLLSSPAEDNDDDDDDNDESSSVSSVESTSSSSSSSEDEAEVDEDELAEGEPEVNLGPAEDEALESRRESASENSSDFQSAQSRSPVDSSQTIQFKLSGCNKNLDDDEDSTCEMVRRMIARRRIRMMQMSQSVRSELVKFDLDDEDMRQQQQQQQMDTQMEVNEEQENCAPDATCRRAGEQVNGKPPGDANSKSNQMMGENLLSSLHGRNSELANQLELASERVGQLERKLSDSYANFSQLELTCKRLENELALVNETHQDELRGMQVKVEQLTRDLALNEAKLAEARDKMQILERQQQQQSVTSKHNHSSQHGHHRSRLLAGNLISPQSIGSTSAAAAKALNWLRHQHQHEHSDSAHQSSGHHLMMGSANNATGHSHMPLMLMHHVKHTLAVNHQQTIGLKLLNQSKQIQRRLNELEYKVDRMSAGQSSAALATSAESKASTSGAAGSAVSMAELQQQQPQAQQAAV